MNSIESFSPTTAALVEGETVDITDVSCDPEALGLLRAMMSGVMPQPPAAPAHLVLTNDGGNAGDTPERLAALLTKALTDPQLPASLAPLIAGLRQSLSSCAGCAPSAQNLDTLQAAIASAPSETPFSPESAAANHMAPGNLPATVVTGMGQLLAALDGMTSKITTAGKDSAEPQVPASEGASRNPMALAQLPSEQGTAFSASPAPEKGLAKLFLAQNRSAGASLRENPEVQPSVLSSNNAFVLIPDTATQPPAAQNIPAITALFPPAPERASSLPGFAGSRTSVPLSGLEQGTGSPATTPSFVIHSPASPGFSNGEQTQFPAPSASAVAWAPQHSSSAPTDAALSASMSKDPAAREVATPRDESPDLAFPPRIIPGIAGPAGARVPEPPVHTGGKDSTDTQGLVTPAFANSSGSVPPSTVSLVIDGTKNFAGDSQVRTNTAASQPESLSPDLQPSDPETSSAGKVSSTSFIPVNQQAVTMLSDANDGIQRNQSSLETPEAAPPPKPIAVSQMSIGDSEIITTLQSIRHALANALSEEDAPPVAKPRVDEPQRADTSLGQSILQTLGAQSSVAFHPATAEPVVKPVLTIERIEQVSALMTEMADQVLVTDPVHGQTPEVRIKIAEHLMPDTEVRVIREAGGQLRVEFETVSPHWARALNDASPLLAQRLIERLPSHEAAPQVVVHQQGEQPQDGRSRSRHNPWDLARQSAES